MASTTWHTVEFSRNRRASFRTSVRPGGNLSNLAVPILCVKPPCVACRSVRAASGASHLAGDEVVGSASSGGCHLRDQPPLRLRCPFLPAGRRREHYAARCLERKSVTW